MRKVPGPIQGATEATPQTGRASVPAGFRGDSALHLPSPTCSPGSLEDPTGLGYVFLLDFVLRDLALAFAIGALVFFIVMCSVCLFKNNINQTQDQTWAPVHWERGVLATGTPRKPWHPCF